jgi:hypothetical protein
MVTTTTTTKDIETISCKQNNGHQLEKDLVYIKHIVDPKSIPKRFLCSRNNAIDAISFSTKYMQYVPLKTQMDIFNSLDEILLIIKRNWRLYDYLIDEHKNNFEIIYIAIEASFGEVYKMLPKNLKNDAYIIQTCCFLNPMILRHLDDGDFTDEFVSMCICMNPDCVVYTDVNELNLTQIIKVISKHPEYYKEMRLKSRSNIDVSYAAIVSDLNNMLYIPGHLLSQTVFCTNIIDAFANLSVKCDISSERNFFICKLNWYMKEIDVNVLLNVGFIFKCYRIFFWLINTNDIKRKYSVKCTIEDILIASNKISGTGNCIVMLIHAMFQIVTNTIERYNSTRRKVECFIGGEHCRNIQLNGNDVFELETRLDIEFRN